MVGCRTCINPAASIISQAREVVVLWFFFFFLVIVLKTFKSGLVWPITAAGYVNLAFHYLSM